MTRPNKRQKHLKRARKIKRVKVRGWDKYQPSVEEVEDEEATPARPGRQAAVTGPYVLMAVWDSGEDCIGSDNDGLVTAGAGWKHLDPEEDSTDEEDCDITDDEGDLIGVDSPPKRDAFRALLKAAEDYEEVPARRESSNAKEFRFQRGPDISKRHERRKNQQAKELAEAARGTRSLKDCFGSFTSPSDSNGSSGTAQADGNFRPPLPEAKEQNERREALAALRRKLQLKTGRPQGQNYDRHEAVMRFMLHQETRQPGETRSYLAWHTARDYGRGRYFAQKLVTWELSWIKTRSIPEGRRGCFAKVKSWLNDEGVQLAVREYFSGAGEHITAYGLARAVGSYLASVKATEVMKDVFERALTAGEQENVNGPVGTGADGGRSRGQGTGSQLRIREDQADDSAKAQRGLHIRVRTARRWLKSEGYLYESTKKGVFVDGHERKDVVDYRNHVFIPRWEELSRRMVVFDEDGNWSMPPGIRLADGEEPLVLVTHDESTFNANDGRRKIWAKGGAQPLRPKGKGKGMMVSGFLTPGGILRVPNSISDAELLRDSSWERDAAGRPVREAIHILEYSKNNYWTGEKMVDQTVRSAIPIFHKAFPGCRAVFAFDNASNHCAFASDALVASNMRLGPGGKQPKMRDGMDHARGLPHAMVFPDNHPVNKLRGEPKGLKVILQERGLWRERRADGFKFQLKCPTTGGRKGCAAELKGECCAQTLMASQPDFKRQRGRLQEEVEAHHHEIIFYPKFHCELNFIERFWCACKHYTRDNCSYDLKGLRKAVPEALHAIPIAQINRYYNHCMRILEAYKSGCTYGTQDFTEKIYRGHRQVVDKSKW